MDSEKLKRAILQHLLKHQDEWIFGRTLGELFSCKRRNYERVIELLRYDEYPVIADKGKGYMITYNKQMQREYYGRCERVLKKEFVKIRTFKTLIESGELFAQPHLIAEQVEKELDAI